MMLFLFQKIKNIVITRGENGAIAIKDSKVYECAAKKLKIKRLNRSR